MAAAAAAAVCSYLPDELWERIFKQFLQTVLFFSYNTTLNSLSVVSKQFLSITNRLKFSLTITDRIFPLLSPPIIIFQRFPNLTSLNFYLSCKTDDFYAILTRISTFPLSDIKSLTIYNTNTCIPADGLRALSEKMKNLKSLSYSRMFAFVRDDLFLIADCFPLLEELELNDPRMTHNFNTLLHGDQLLALPKLRKINLSGNFINRKIILIQGNIIQE